MPTYVYRREDGTTFEVQQRITEDPLTEDPETGQKVTRIISGNAGLVFKGSGFYLTDYARSGKGGGSEGGAKAEGGGSKESGTSSSSATEGGTSSSNGGSKSGAA